MALWLLENLSPVQSYPVPRLCAGGLLSSVYYMMLILFILVSVPFIVKVLKYFSELGEGDGTLKETKKWFTGILYFSFQRFKLYICNIKVPSPDWTVFRNSHQFS